MAIILINDYLIWESLKTNMGKCVFTQYSTNVVGRALLKMYLRMTGNVLMKRWGDGSAWQPMQCRLIIKLALGKLKCIAKLLLASVWCLIWQPRHEVLSLLARARRKRWQFIFCTNVFGCSASDDRRQRLWTWDRIGRCARLTWEGLNLNNYPCTACKASG